MWWIRDGGWRGCKLKNELAVVEKQVWGGSWGRGRTLEILDERPSCRQQQGTTKPPGVGICREHHASGWLRRRLCGAGDLYGLISPSAAQTSYRTSFFFLIIPMSLRKYKVESVLCGPDPMCRWYKVSLGSHHKYFIFMFVPNSYCLVPHLGAALDSVRLSCPFYRCNKRLVSGRYYTNDAAPWHLEHQYWVSAPAELHK